MIVVSQDVEGIRAAALEIFEHSLSMERIERQLSRLEPDDPQREKLLPVRKLSEGYYDWAMYLLWLRNKLAAGIAFSEITADEAEGISAIALAIQDFDRQHPFCGHCGERGFRGMRACPNCSKEIG
jgi:NADH pyrophosphatase NudC (nudix superfamily)